MSKTTGLPYLGHEDQPRGGRALTAEPPIATAKPAPTAHSWDAQQLGPRRPAAAHPRPAECCVPPGFLLSVVIPVHNEASTLQEVIRRVRASGVPCEIIVVDDGSTDGSSQMLARLLGPPWLKGLAHPSRRGKGAAVRTGLTCVRGDAVVVQDADLEYDPADYLRLLEPLLQGRADVVYGSRLSSSDRSAWPLWHQCGNRLITLLSNMLTRGKLTDVETCYKVIRRELIDAIAPNLRENGFGIELEITAKLARRPGVRFDERPISYTPRSYAQGKKIRPRDVLRALWCIVRY